MLLIPSPVDVVFLSDEFNDGDDDDDDDVDDAVVDAGGDGGSGDGDGFSFSSNVSNWGNISRHFLYVLLDYQVLDY